MDSVQTYRNPGLVIILNKLHYIENFGTGIPRIFQAYKGDKRQPEFNPSGNFFMVTLPNRNYFDSINIKNDKLTDFDLASLQSIQSNPGITTKKLLETVKKKDPETTIFDVKNSFKRKIRDYIEFKGSRRNGGYYIKKCEDPVNENPQNKIK